MRRPGTYVALEEFGRVRLSRHFYMRDFLMSEIASFHGRTNVPDDPDLAIAAGRRLCEGLLEPLVETFGPIAVRSGFRSAALNDFGATTARPQKCSRNAHSRARHIWDHRDADGAMGATASIVVPWFADQYERGRDWRDLAYFLHDHLPPAQLTFFPRLAAFNISWHERRTRRIDSYIAPKGLLVRPGEPPSESETERRSRYGDFPPWRAIAYPALPGA